MDEPDRESVTQSFNLQGQEQELQLAQVENLAPSKSPGFHEGLARKLARHYFEMASPEALKLRSPERLVDVAIGHAELALQRAPGEVLVRVMPGDPRSALGLAIVQTCADDMPYLFDSAVIAVRNAGMSIDWAVHPVLRVRRGSAGELVDLDPAFDSDSADPAGLESWIHIETEVPTDQAAYAAVESALHNAFSDLRQAVADFPLMHARASEAAVHLRGVARGERAEEIHEAAEFLDWMVDEHFLFLGYFETVSEALESGGAQLINLPAAALGLARPGARFSDSDALIAPREELNKYAESPRVVVVTKANQRSPIHLNDFLDVVSVKLFAADGSVSGTARFIGLFASDVYVDRPRTIPLIRRKAEYIVRRARFPEGSHSAKHLREILHLLPRDELFQSSEDELYHTCMGIRALRDRHTLKLFLRRDRYGRFYSVMIYLPRDRYSRELRDRVSAELLKAFNGLSVDRSVDFQRGGLARIRCIVRTPPGTVVSLSADELEARLIAATRSWRDQLREVLLRTQGVDSSRFLDAFPLSYTESNTALEAAADILHLQRLSSEAPLLPRLQVDGLEGAEVCANALKLYAWNAPVALSDVLPALENFGLRVIRQEPSEVRPADGSTLWIQEFEIRHTSECGLTPEAQKSFFENAFLKTWRGETENDGLNRLVLSAGLDWRQVACLRMLAKYINQVGLPYGREVIEKVLADHSRIARLLVRLFESRFDPAIAAERRTQEALRHGQELDAELDKIASLDADRVLRTFLSVIRAALRTNFFQSRADGSRKPWVSLKLDPSKVPELPRPRPMFEVWVYAPEVEGVHLRGGRVARGGLRWSDRREDFRTEVLGLMKAQMVKNAVIVPVGAKGGFVVKQPVDSGNREAWMGQGIACYQTFLRGLLDITDNRVGDRVIHPADVVRYDDDDPYLVVAADKGTASFSDIANTVAAEYGFWLGDAFASGGSVGYDHKKMGITARGAWESVKRHFREMGQDIQTQPLSVVGIGDMSGDVFGNGMLLSPQIRLLAAFDHRHIFIDPSPDPAVSFAERQRLFALPRSSWADYDAQLISAGGGVFPRSLKLIRLSDEARSALGFDSISMTPAQLMNAILKAPVDLLWNGGIGTYVKGSTQGHDQVGDRANDALRVNGDELRCKVVGEGGNLGFTQLGRIEYALAGGRINTDAIDNAGGVHSSDREVNIKIPLNQLMAEGRLTREERDPLLASMTEDIIRFVLHDNYIQPGCISQEEQLAAGRLDEHAQLIRTLERDGLLDRAIEYLPDEETLIERRKESRGLTRPELAVLVAYAKISLFDSALSSDMPDDPFFIRDLLGNFPPALVQQFREPLQNHRLKREIIATILSNAVVNRMGVAFAHGLAEDHGTTRDEVLKAYAVAHEIYAADSYWSAIEALDNQVSAELQSRLMRRAIGLLKHATRWMISTRLTEHLSVGELVARYGEAVAAVGERLPEALPPLYRAEWDQAVSGMRADQVPEPLAVKLANTLVLGSAMDIADLASEAKVTLTEASAVYFASGERFRLLWMHSAILGLQVQGKWQVLARNNLRDDAYRLHRMLARRLLQFAGASPEARIEAWIAESDRTIQFALNRIQEFQVAGNPDFLGLAVVVRELRKLVSL